MAKNKAERNDNLVEAVKITQQLETAAVSMGKKAPVESSAPPDKEAAVQAEGKAAQAPGKVIRSAKAIGGLYKAAEQGKVQAPREKTIQDNLPSNNVPLKKEMPVPAERHENLKTSDSDFSENPRENIKQPAGKGNEEFTSPIEPLDFNTPVYRDYGDIRVRTHREPIQPQREGMPAQNSSPFHEREHIVKGKQGNDEEGTADNSDSPIVKFVSPADQQIHTKADVNEAAYREATVEGGVRKVTRGPGSTGYISGR